MRKLLAILIFGIICVSGTSCSGGSDGDIELTDSTPLAPTLIFPAQNELCITNLLEFKWNASTNTDGGPLLYVFEIAKDNQFSNIVISEVQTSTSKIVTLEKGVAYFWRVKAKSVKNIESAYSAISKFYTEEIPNSNHLPFAPALANPNLGQTLNNTTTVNLQWSATDIDLDPLKYDVFFGKDKDALVLVAENIENTNFEVSLNTAQTTYFWKVIVKDNKGTAVTGPIWHFKVGAL